MGGLGCAAGDGVPKTSNGQKHVVECCLNAEDLPIYAGKLRGHLALPMEHVFRRYHSSRGCRKRWRTSRSSSSSSSSSSVGLASGRSSVGGQASLCLGSPNAACVDLRVHTSYSIMSIRLRLCLRSNLRSLPLSRSSSRNGRGLRLIALVRHPELKLVCITPWTCSYASASLRCYVQVAATYQTRCVYQGQRFMLPHCIHQVG